MDAVMTDTERCYTSNCECWVVSNRFGAKRRDEADPLGRPSLMDLEFLCLCFVPHRNTPKLKLLGTNFEAWDLVNPRDDGDDEGGSDMINHISPPPPTSSSTELLHIPLFSLACVTRTERRLDEDGKRVLQPGVYDDVGLSYSLPICPPPSQLILSREHRLPDDADGPHIIGSCNGLYCLLSVPACVKVSVVVWNPTTAVSRKLPPFSGSDWDWDWDCGGLTFGFGYDQSSGDYKVVKIDAENLQVEVFSLYSDSTSWRTVHNFDRCWDFQWRFANGAVSFAGCLNWLVSDDCEAMVASFDLATETFRMLPLPSTYGTTRSHYLLGSSLWILDGCLSFVILHGLSPECGLSGFPAWHSRVLDIWIMREYGLESSWTSAATIALPHYVFFPYRILYLSKDVLILDNNRRPFVFNLKENSLVCPSIQGTTHGFGGIEPYVQSEVSPYCRTEELC